MPSVKPSYLTQFTRETIIVSKNILQSNGDLTKDILKDPTRSSEKETLNVLPDHGADEFVNVSECERSQDRNGCCSGHYERNFSATAEM